MIKLFFKKVLYFIVQIHQKHLTSHHTELFCGKKEEKNPPYRVDIYILYEVQHLGVN